MCLGVFGFAHLGIEFFAAAHYSPCLTAGRSSLCKEAATCEAAG